jgi:DNA polymerase II small subunit/DNA polymerase delta subunit B
MRFYRIKQISENEFIPQTKKWFDFWEGIATKDFYLWFSVRYQELYCIVSTKEKAKQVIEEYKKQRKVKDEYPKYYKI